MNDSRPGFATPFNVVAAFPDATQARAAISTLTSEGIPDDAIHLGIRGRATEGEKMAEVRAEMQDELVNTWGGPAFFMTGPQAKGAFAGVVVSTVAGILVGLAAGLAWAFLIDDATLSRLARVVIVTMVSAVAFATAGFIAGGSLKPRRDAADDPERPMDDRRMVAERDVVVGVHSEQRLTAERSAAILHRVGADRVDLVDAEGTPLPPQHRHPRPADPQDWWWRNASRG